MLYDILSDDETLKGMVGGTFRADTDRIHLHGGIAVATSKRVLFLDKGLLGSTEVMDIPYASIEAITYSTGIMFGGIRVMGRGTANFGIEDIQEKASMQPFADCVKAHIEAATDIAQGTPAPSVADEIAGLAALMERGALTQEEFAAKKRQMLGI